MLVAWVPNRSSRGVCPDRLHRRDRSNRAAARTDGGVPGQRNLPRLMLASWLLWTAVGSGLAGRWTPPVGVIQILIALALPTPVVVVRAARQILHTVPGEVLGPGSMLGRFLAALAPLCILCGALFTAGTRLYADHAGEAGASAYLWEAVGSSAGGLIAGLVLVRYLGSLEITWWLAVLNLMAVCARRISVCVVIALTAAPRLWCSWTSLIDGRTAAAIPCMESWPW